MRNKLTLISVFLLLAAIPAFSQFTFPVQDPKNITFAYGSCNEVEKDVEGKIFYQIIKEKPDIWTWIGDVIYIESNELSDVEELYYDTKRAPGYQALLKEVPVIGIWDDHDLGPDNGGKYYPYKERNRQLFLNFIGEPLASARWHLDGLYSSYYLGEDQQVKVILLDNRYNKDVRMSFAPGRSILDDQQWVWLEEQLSMNDSTWTVITSGIQIFPDDRLYPEVWFTDSKEQLLGLIRKTKRSGVILLSGDVHYAEIMEYPCPQRIGYSGSLTELTSSGLTHYLEDLEPLLDAIYPNTYSTPADRYLGKNYGIIRFESTGEEPMAILEIHSKKGNIVLTKTIKYSEVTFNETMIDMEAECAEDVGKISRFSRNIFYQFYEGKGVAIAVVLVVLLVGLLIIWCWAALIFWRIDKRRGKEFKTKDEKRAYMAMKYKYRSV